MGDHSPDGICLDRDGAVWYADVGDRCCVRISQGGQVLERVQLDRGAFACMLGGTDGSVLQYGPTRGYKPLREATLSLMNDRGIESVAERVVRTAPCTVLTLRPALERN